MRHRWLNRLQCRFVIERFVETHNRSGLPEPIPRPTLEQLDEAGGLIASANERYFGQQRFKELIPKVAFAFYELVKQHIFVNGNKRIATYVLLHLLEVHGFMLYVDQAYLADFAEGVAASDPADRDKQMVRIRTMIRKNLMTIEAYKMVQKLGRV